MGQNLNRKEIILLELLKSLQLFGDNYMESILFLLKSRKDLFVDIDANFKKINTLTYCSVVIFFSYVENTAISIKRLLIKGIDAKVINISSKKQHELVNKDEGRLSFEDIMKLTFSVFPGLFGLGNHYGDIKGRDLKSLFLLRDIRNVIIHPKGIEDIFVSLKALGGRDINLPMMNYIKALQNLINICAKKI